MNRLSFKKEEIIDICLFIPFFLPFSLSLLASTSYFWLIVSRFFTLTRYCISSILILKTIQESRNYQINAVVFFCLSFILMRVIASIINGSIYIGFALSIISYSGFLFMLEYLKKRRGISYCLKVLSRMFFGFFLIGGITILIWPNGFNNASSKAEALYFLGSKNSSFYYFYGFLSFYCLWLLVDNKKLSFTCDVFFIIAIIASIICDSSNSAGSITVLYLVYLSIKNSNRLYRFWNPRLILLLVLILAMILLFGKQSRLLTVIFRLLGRDSTLTGRDYIWREQLLLVPNSPLWGNGIETSTVLLSSAIATHAHNFYLDIVVKYGMITFISFLAILFVVSSRITKMPRSKYKGFMVGILFVILLHNIFDDVSLYLLFTVFFLSNTVPNSLATIK